MANSQSNSFKPIIFFPRPGRLSDHLNSRLRSLDIDQELVDAVLTQYGFDLTRKPKNLPNTRRNTNLIIETNQGRMVLKKYRPDWLASTIEFEHSILRKLAEMNFSAPRLIPLPDGNTWLNIDGQNYCVFDFIPGRNYSSSFLVRPHRVRMMATSGRTLALLHRQLQGFQPDGQHHLGFVGYDQDRLRDVSWHAGKIEELAGRSSKITIPEDQEQANWLIRNSPELYQTMVELDDVLQNAHLPRLIIHGDYGLHNLIYTNLDHAIPVDYELARLEWRMSDLVSVISKFRYKDGSYDFESITRFLHAYQHEFPIPQEEWQFFPLVWKFYRLMKAVQYWISYFETNGPVRKLYSSRHEFEHSNWALEHPEKLAQFKVRD